MTTTNTNTAPSASQIILAGAAAEGHGALAGAAAEGHGALVGWQGAGELPRGQIEAALAEAGLPADWAPRSKSDVGHAGAALARISHGWIWRRADGSVWTKQDGAKTRSYRARWTIARSRAAVAEVGERLGEVAVVVELLDGSDELRVRDDGSREAAALAEQVRVAYRAARDAELLSSGDVTRWLHSTLISRCGAARFGTCLYVPRAGRDEASRLAAAVSARWGCAWMSPLLPVASSAELAEGLGRGLAADAEALWADLAASRDAALRRAREKDAAVERAEVSPVVAARLLRECADLLSRVDQYAPLAGEHAAAARARVAELRALLEPLADAASQRMSLLELDGEPAARPARGRRLVSPTRAADEALGRRRAEQAAAAAPSAREQSVAERPLDLDGPAEEVLPPGWMPEGVRTWLDELAAARNA